MEMIENCQNKADRSAGCRCQITPYDEKSEGPRGHWSLTNFRNLD